MRPQEVSILGREQNCARPVAEGLSREAAISHQYMLTAMSFQSLAPHNHALPTSWYFCTVISHKPAGIHGDRIVKSHPVTLLDHSMSPTTSILAWSSSPSPSSSSSSLSSSATRHQDRTRPPLEYRIIGPPQALGSSDPFSFDCKIRRNGNAEVPKRISIEFRRELMYSQAEAQSTPHYFEAPGVPTLPSKHSAHTLHNRSGSTPKMPHHEIPAATTHRRAQSGEVKVSQSSSRRRLSDDANSHEEGRDKKVARSSGLRDALVAPPTPPQSIPSPIEYDESSNNSGSSFGLFGPPSTTSAASASHHQRHQATPFHSSPSDSRSSTPYLFPVRSPPATAPSAPSSSFSLLPSRTATHPKRKKDDVSLAVYESDIHFSSIHPDGTAVWYGNIQGVLPKAKSLYHYALGESCCTTAARSRFYMTVRVSWSRSGKGAVPRLRYWKQKVFFQILRAKCTCKSFVPTDSLQAEGPLHRASQQDHRLHHNLKGRAGESERTAQSDPRHPKSRSQIIRRIATAARLQRVFLFVHLDTRRRGRREGTAICISPR